MASSEQEKLQAALLSVFWAFFLTAIKLVIGLMTNSLGLLSEALHSALDLLAAAMTWFAVRLALKPADKEHHYGHGKAENISALVETALLFVTCGWIAGEAIERLFFNEAAVHPSWWGVGVILVSLCVDIHRASMLRRAARKFGSQALEADAMHFATDIWSSAAVLFGLLCLEFAKAVPQDWFLSSVLPKADAAAALAVSFIAAFTGIRMAGKSLASLMDASVGDRAEQVESALGNRLPQYAVRRLRMRESGSDVFADLTLEVPGHLPLETAHEASMAAEDVIREIIPSADIVVHLEPEKSADSNLMAHIRAMAMAHQLSVHHVLLFSENGGHRVLLHVEVDPDTTLEDAHNRVCVFEKALSSDLGDAVIVTHLEPADNGGDSKGHVVSVDRFQRIICSVLAHYPEIASPHRIRIDVCGGKSEASFHCEMRADMTVSEAHHIATMAEREILGAMPELDLLFIHTDPVACEPQTQPMDNDADFHVLKG
ncbi:MAG: cation diffusion facilitator family transporter [Desulfovibrionaceae bacterium]|nr:cation diffusion facilitator family transporter [Desulfovibrionaceae bacterium]